MIGDLIFARFSKHILEVLKMIRGVQFFQCAKKLKHAQVHLFL